MASNSLEPDTSNKRGAFSGGMHTLKKHGQPLVAFWTKFTNDWSLNNAAGLAYNLMLAIFPIIIALVSLLGLFLGTLDPYIYQSNIDKITSTFSSLAEARPLVAAAFAQVKKDAGVLGMIAVVLSIFNGSRLFLFMEGCLDIIYHVRPRGVIAQNVMAILMLLLFVVILPIVVVASAIPAFVFSLLQKTPLDQLPGSSFIFSLGGILSGLIAAYILFQVIYIVVPNQKINIGHSWPGAVVAAVLLEIYLTLFPLYVAHFLGFFAGALGLLIVLIFFYYFALILLLGAEVNAFFAQGVRVTPQDLVTMVHDVTSHLATSEEAVKEQAAATHKDEVPKDIRPKYERSSRTAEKTESKGARQISPPLSASETTKRSES
jgi:membrane protein